MTEAIPNLFLNWTWCPKPSFTNCVVRKKNLLETCRNGSRTKDDHCAGEVLSLCGLDCGEIMSMR